MNRSILLFVVIFLLAKDADLLSIKYRRWCSPWKFCSLTAWKPWSACDRTCGGGQRTRFRQMCSLPVIDFAQHVAMCNRKASDLIEYENCSQTCSPYGTWSDESNRCVCDDESTVDSCCMTGERKLASVFKIYSYYYRSWAMVWMVIVVWMRRQVWNIWRT